MSLSGWIIEQIPGKFTANDLDTIEDFTKELLKLQNSEKKIDLQFEQLRGLMRYEAMKTIERPYDENSVCPHCGHKDFTVKECNEDTTELLNCDACRQDFIGVYKEDWTSIDEEDRANCKRAEGLLDVLYKPEVE